MTVEYGTLEPVVAQKRSTKTVVAAVVGILVVSAVVAMSVTAGVKTNSAVNSNFGRGANSKVSEDVVTRFGAICDDMETRFVVATFNKELTEIVPAVQVGASTHWEKDWKAFMSALPDTSTGPGIAFSVYNFPVWDDADDFTVMPTFVTFLAADADESAKYLGGAFLGGAALAAAPCTGRNSVRVTEDMTYLDACTQLTGDESRCKAVDTEACPFEGEMNPCACPTCEGVTNYAYDSFSEDCCGTIKSWCAAPLPDGSAKPGCSDYAVSIYDDICNPAYALGDVQKVLLTGFADETDNCDELCGNSCNFLAEDQGSAASTYKLCSGCATNHQDIEQVSGSVFTANCHPDAIGFENFRCCGVRDSTASCGEFSDKNACESIPDLDLGCEWIGHVDCSDSIAVAAEEDRIAEEARIAAEEAAAAAELAAAAADAATTAAPE